MRIILEGNAKELATFGSSFVNKITQLVVSRKDVEAGIDGAEQMIGTWNAVQWTRKLKERYDDLENGRLPFE